MSHFQFTPPGSCSRLLNADCSGASGHQGLTIICQFYLISDAPNAALNTLCCQHALCVCRDTWLCQKVSLRDTQRVTTQGHVRATCPPSTEPRKLPCSEENWWFHRRKKHLAACCWLNAFCTRSHQLLSTGSVVVGAGWGVTRELQPTFRHSSHGYKKKLHSQCALSGALQKGQFWEKR